MIWTGANDGPFHVTRDGGRTWADVTPPTQPKGCRVQNIEPSPHHAASAYYAVVCYLLGDFRPYLWRTDDFGATWTLLTTQLNGIPYDSPTRVVREDPVRQGLLYAGTEFGMFVSFDNGARWHSLQLNLPVTPVTDIKVQRGDLVLSTQGRSYWILDDVEPLRQLSNRMAAESVYLLQPREAWRMRYPAAFGGEESNRTSTSDPQYPPPGAMIDYWLAPGATSPVTIEILDGAGKLIRRFSTESRVDTSSVPVMDSLPRLEGATPRLTRNSGVNRFIWDLRYAGPWDSNPRDRGRGGPLALPGKYVVRLRSGAVSNTRSLLVRADPRIARDGVTFDVLRQQLAHNLRVRDLVTEVNVAVAQLESARRRTPIGSAPRLRLDSLERLLVTPPVRYSRPGLQAHIQYLYSAMNGADQKLSRDAVERHRTLRREFDVVKKELDAELRKNGTDRRAAAFNR